MAILICFLIAGVCFWLVALINKGEDKIENIRQLSVNEVVKENKITISKRYDMKMVYTLIHDNKKKCIWVILYSRPKDFIKQFNYQDIIQVEMKEDDETVSVTSRTSQLGGALVGGALAGGVGAVIGGLSGKQKQKRAVKSIKLILTIDDLENPIYTIEIERFHKPADTNSREYANAYNVALNWFKLLEVIIKQGDKEYNVERNKQLMNNDETKILNSSVADELTKLALLLREGVLTEEEFNIQKKRLLSS
ncbi:SHOCT domain-containing protein [Niallia circulans]|uniref:SHOCT domain-containing protein n=1 Tax=Niallia circulans TaxID=1397 RepID=A0A553SJ46_NIACI|nr:SHOCT domain-containing protein [Niallia circulans]TRZ37009.1 SHOCT domain-containing protein [Niallia circulans]